MRPLTERQANRCENAKHPRCRCRCKGAFHGKGRVVSGEFSLLPADDPHYRPLGMPKPKSARQMIFEEQAALAQERMRRGVLE